MYEEIDVQEHRSHPPALFNALTEIPRTLLDMGRLWAAMPLLALSPRGERHTVMFLPGFLAGDESTAMLRRFAQRLGYDAQPWQLGRNSGRLEIMQARLPTRFDEVFQNAKGRVSLIGQSLGGVYARELARLYPEKVRQVITLGSPFGTVNTGTTMPVVARLFEQQTGMTVEQMRDAIDQMDPHVSPPIPLTAIYSKGDGVVNWRVCLEANEDHQTENIEVCGSHCGMGFNAAIYRIIADRLAQKEDAWEKYRSRTLVNLSRRRAVPLRSVKEA